MITPAIFEDEMRNTTRYDDAVILMIHTLESMGYAAGTQIFRDRMTNDNRTDKQ